MAEIALNAASGSCEHCRRPATSFDEAEVVVNEGFGHMHKLITATVTSAMSTGTGDRPENEQDSLRKALFLLHQILNGEDRKATRGGRDRVEEWEGL